MPVSLVMPCYNEAGVIEETVRTYYAEVIAKLQGSELTVVDDSSTDETPNILERLKKDLPELRVLKTPSNSGHGTALRLGYETTRNEWIFQVDSDNQFEAQDFWKLWQARSASPFVIGVRKNRKDPFHRLILSKIIRSANWVLFGIWLKDANCPFRLVKREVLMDLLSEIKPESLAPNLMIALLAKRKKIEMAEVTVTHRDRRTGKASLVSWRLLKFCTKGFFELLKMRFQKG